MIDTPHGDAPPTPDPTAFQAELVNHAAWLESGRAMLAVADVIWAALEQLTVERRQKLDAMVQAVRASNALPGTEILGGMIVFPAEPRKDLIALTGCTDAYLMNAGYAVENFLKAVRIKRLLGEGKSVEFGRGRDRIPPNHHYVDFAGVELGDLSEQEVDLLNRLTLFVTWAGRYHVARKSLPIDALNARKFYGRDRQQIHTLCQRLIERYDALS